MNNKEWKKWLFWFSFAVASIIVYKTIDSASEILIVITEFFNLLMPFFIAIIIAYILYIPCKKIEGIFSKKKIKILKKHSRGLSVFLTYTVVVILLFLIFNFVIPNISTSVYDLAHNLPNYFNMAIEYAEDINASEFPIKMDLTELINGIKDIKIDKALLNILSLDNLNSYIKGIIGATNIIFDAFVTIIVSIYMLLERNNIKEFLKKFAASIFNDKTYKYIAKYYRRTNGILFSFISSQILDAFLVGIIVTIVMLIMNIKYGALLGFIIGLFNIIPYFGAIVAITIAILITIFTEGIAKAIMLGIIIIILQQIDANIINPKILGSSLKLSPILIIFAVSVGGTYFGVLGMLLGVPVVAFVKLLLDDYINIKLADK